jgi:serine/threonine protein kinase
LFDRSFSSKPKSNSSHFLASFYFFTCSVGFDFQGRVKLFDFGLAKELDPKQKCATTTTTTSAGVGTTGSPEKNVMSSSSNSADNNMNTNTDLYNMSGGTGSRRFMAPEVALSEPYNLSADIYSYSILLWELLTLDKAFGNLSPEDHRDMCVKMNQRLELRKSWSITIQTLLQGCWARNPQERPTAREVYKVLKQEIDRIYEEDFLSVAQQLQSDDDRRKSM